MTMTRKDFQELAEEISEIEHSAARFPTSARFIACEAVAKAAKRVNNRFMVYRFAEACKLTKAQCANLEARL